MYVLTLFQIRLSGPKGNFGPPSDFSPLPPSQLPDPTKANSQILPHCPSFTAHTTPQLIHKSHALTMGIQGLLPMLPGGAMSDSYMGFSRLRSLISPESHAISDDSRKIKADIDTGTLLYVCALKHRIAYNAGDYTHSVAEFHRQIVSLRVVYKWDMTIIFDGSPPPEKSPEHDRRKSKGDDGNNIIITSEFIALCAHAFKRYFHNFVVSPAEADMQVCRRDPTAIAVTRDSDLVAYGLKTIVIVDNYSREEFRLIDMDCAVTDDTKEQYPLFWYYKKYGLQIIHFWAAVMGCDISKGPTKVGIDGIGKKVFFSALDSFDSQQSTTIIDSQTFAKVLRENANSFRVSLNNLQFA